MREKMENKKLLSIIIPVYNSADFVKQSIESCMQQNIDAKEYEVLCVVDDGTTDNSREIIKDLMKTYSNLRIAENEHGYVSVSRNKGVLLAEGEYIWFVDDDDLIKENCLKDIKEIIIKDKVDIINIWGKKFPKEYSDDLIKYQGYIWMHIEKRDVIIQNNLKFNPSIKHGKDELFHALLATKCKTKYDYNEILYFYRQNEKSSMALANKHVWTRVNDMFMSAVIAKDALEKGEDSIYLASFLRMRLYDIITILKPQLNNKKVKEYINKCLKEKLYSCEVLFKYYPKEEISTEKELIQAGAPVVKKLIIKFKKFIRKKLK